jgi:hypothetical protein
MKRFAPERHLMIGARQAVRFLSKQPPVTNPLPIKRASIMSNSNESPEVPVSNEEELAEEQLDEVSGGLNPQPLPPRYSH